MNALYGLNALTGAGRIAFPLTADEHALKSAAGKLFRLEDVTSVCVHNDAGMVSLYLKKTDSGVVREEN